MLWHDHSGDCSKLASGSKSTLLRQIMINSREDLEADESRVQLRPATPIELNLHDIHVRNCCLHLGIQVSFNCPGVNFNNESKAR